MNPWTICEGCGLRISPGANEGESTQAEAFYKRAVGILEASLGQRHTELGTVLKNLARLYREQNRYIEAEPLYRRTLDILEKSSDPLFGVILNEYAALLRAMSRWVEANDLELHSKNSKPIQLELLRTLSGRWILALCQNQPLFCRPPKVLSAAKP